MHDSIKNKTTAATSQSSGYVFNLVSTILYNCHYFQKRSTENNLKVDHTLEQVIIASDADKKANTITLPSNR